MPTPAAAPAPVAARTVEQLCGGKGYWAREWCETKACFQADYQYDAICKQRRDQRPSNQP